MKEINVLMVGVGGQGVILASDTMSEIGTNNGYDVKKSDSLGMAQRGGGVVSHVRWAERGLLHRIWRRPRGAGFATGIRGGVCRLVPHNPHIGSTS